MAYPVTNIMNSTNEIYYKNHVFDDLSNEFVGIKSEFTYKSNGQDVIGITSSTVVLVNNIFQSPQGILPNEVGEYENFEDTNVGITSVRFLGIGTPFGDDANRGNMPIGGLIVSIGSQEGFGYQPLVAAGGTAIISGLGTVSSVSIGNSGSGYRVGMQTNILVKAVGSSGIVTIGKANVSAGLVTSVTITNGGGSGILFWLDRRATRVRCNQSKNIQKVVLATTPICARERLRVQE